MVESSWLLTLKFEPGRFGHTLHLDHLLWLRLIRDHIATSLSIEQDYLDYTPFNHEGGLGKAHQLFGDQLPKLFKEVNHALAA